MDITHIAELVVVSLFGAGGSWMAVTLKIKYLEDWTAKHDDKDDKRFDHIGTRLDTLIDRSR